MLKALRNWTPWTVVARPMDKLSLQHLNSLLQAAAQERRQQVPRHILRISMQRPSMKNVSAKKLGTSSPDKWTKWNCLTKKRNSLNKKYFTRSLKTTDYKGLNLLWRTSFQERLLEEEHSEKCVFADTGRQMKLLRSRRWRSKRCFIKIKLHMCEPKETFFP